MKFSPLISICIPTYNRRALLKECLDSIVIQFKNKHVFDNTEVIISDNASTDNTRLLVKKYINKYKNIKYFRNKKNIGVVKNVMKVAKHSNGKYIWFFSDDDVHKPNSIERVLDTNSTNPDVIFVNLDAINKNGVVFQENILGIDHDLFFHNRKDFFIYLSNKFPYAIDWLTTFYSILIVNKKVFKKSLYLSSQFRSKYDVFPHNLGIFYSRMDLKIHVFSKRLILFRANNTSWSPKNKLEFLKFWDKALINHYSKITKINEDVINSKFRINLGIKYIIRRIRLLFEIIIDPVKRL